VWLPAHKNVTLAQLTPLLFPLQKAVIGYSAVKEYKNKICSILALA